MALVHRIRILQMEIAVHPVRDARKAGVAVHRDGGGAVEDGGGVEDIVNFFILEQPVGMDAGSGAVEGAADKRRARRHDVADVLFKELRNVGDGGKVHAVLRAAQLRVFDRHGLQRAVAGALADAQQRAVDRRAAVEPGRVGVGHDLVKIVVAVPFQPAGGHVRIVPQAVHDARHRPGQRNAGEGHAVAQRIAGADLDADAALLGKVHQFRGKRHHKTIKVRARDVLKVAAGTDAVVQRRAHNAQVLVHRLAAGHVHLFEDVVVRAGDQDARFLQAHLLDQLKVLFVGADPGGDLREFQPQLLALAHRLLVLFGVEEELALAHDALGAAQTGEELEETDDLIHREGRGALLAVAEGGVGDPDLLRHVQRNDAVVERDLGNLRVFVQFPVEIRLVHVLQLILVVGLLQQVALSVEFQHR